MGREAELSAFQQLLRAKRRFLIPATIFLLIFYFMLPVSIICFPQVMNHPVFSGVTPAWAFAFAQFVMVWVLGGLYYKKSKKFDRLAGKIEVEEKGRFR
ncbi:MAG TPA: DUF485 domain-containing protein [Bacillales bacterium]